MVVVRPAVPLSLPFSRRAIKLSNLLATQNIPVLVERMPGVVNRYRDILNQLARAATWTMATRVDMETEPRSMLFVFVSSDAVRFAHYEMPKGAQYEQLIWDVSQAGSMTLLRKLEATEDLKPVVWKSYAECQAYLRIVIRNAWTDAINHVTKHSLKSILDLSRPKSARASSDAESDDPPAASSDPQPPST
jgi:hypothetical protein